MKYGNPSQAATRRNNYLIERPQYALSYNCSAGISNWASWQLNRSWLGVIKRSDDFRPDPDLPEKCYASKPNDYRGSGYDRGHLVPSGDRSRRQEDNSATFFMSNIIPQAPSNNREVWREFEEYCRDLVFEGKELYIVAGGSELAEAIAKNRVVVQKYNWKVVLILDRLRDEVTTDNAQTIAVWIPNSKEVANTDWRDYIVPVNTVEKKTGYDFFDRLPKALQQQIER
ncbi:DNA/RNA non-specific endonuclease [Waterburya agarophytonicola K14]|uniref:Endonuclease n=1 Tax=Waterburya agarophytonicola KI4 TaxID=2874699 RepID=A0A964BNV8_9CYAN|nr:DNA/RNA non-specific endonuclease [Waterburya agarophytonicola]MCC0175793.1 DNA/RNA non-specific endonuclease [Waterburya agarophytonicola KI4]